MRRDEFIAKITDILSSIEKVRAKLNNGTDNSFTIAKTKSYLHTLDKIHSNISVINKYNFYANSQYYSTKERNAIEETIQFLDRHLLMAADALITDENHEIISDISDALVGYARIARLISHTINSNNINSTIDNKIAGEMIKISELKNEIDISLTNTRIMLKSSTTANERIAEIAKNLSEEKEKSITDNNEISNILSRSRTALGNIENINETLKNADITFAEISSRYNKTYDHLSNLVNNSKHEIEDLLGKTETINKINGVITSEIAQSQELLGKAKMALNLSGTYRLSRHFKSAYELANKNKWLWAIISVISAIVCMAFIGYMLYEMHFIDKSQGNTQGSHLFLLFLARFSMIPILIGFFAFSAMQYVKQNQITEDYAHKKLLSETLISFRQEIERNGSDKASVFMDSILKAVLNSPLNSIDKKAHANEINKINELINTSTQINREILNRFSPDTEKGKDEEKPAKN
ncbi:hypothetical protein M8S10_03495 [Enterobacter chuandaensis]|uniref:hypothetical protein n=1 Tax=Enterobacter chuandaensis TaxID=2497875 RepID=UPI002075F493|nr:hypothetical protein [Enterobacter chuandaensis]MCM7587880.1 hypothetical protein [Enterobacter chuandaensis]